MSKTLVASALHLSIPADLSLNVTSYIWGLVGKIPADEIINKAVAEFGAGLPVDERADLVTALEGLVHFGEHFAANKLGVPS